MEILLLGPADLRGIKVSLPFGPLSGTNGIKRVLTDNNSLLNIVSQIPLKGSVMVDNLGLDSYLNTLKMEISVRTTLKVLESPASNRRRSGPGMMRGSPLLVATRGPSNRQVVGLPLFHCWINRKHSFK